MGALPAYRKICSQNALQTELAHVCRLFGNRGLARQMG
jgi:hypothetical protein